MTVGESIRYHRKRLNLTQAQLAERLNVTAQAVSRWENDTGLPDITMAVPLARALGTTTDELLRFGERYQEFECLWRNTMKAYGDHPVYLLPVAEDALKEFPYDDIFLLRASVCCERLAEYVDDPRESSQYIGRAMAYAHHHDEMAPDRHPIYPHLFEKVVLNDKGEYVLKRKQ